MKAKAKQETHNGVKKFYPTVEFFSKATGVMEYFFNEPHPTRSQAITAAKKYIKNLN
jgi:hypothetical protein